jgi:hypothetical protein
LPDSGGNAPVNCRSAENQVERLLLDLANAYYVPIADMKNPYIM